MNLKARIQKWLQLKELETQMNEKFNTMQKYCESVDTEEIKKAVVEAISELISREDSITFSYWSGVRKKEVNANFEKLIYSLSTNDIENQIKEKVNKEEFIDAIIERIKKKQL